MTKYHYSIILGVTLFSLVLLVLPKLLALDYGSPKTTLYITNDKDTHYDSLVISRAPLDFQMLENDKQDESQAIDRESSFRYFNFYFNNNPQLLLWIMAHAIGLGISFSMLPFLRSHFVQIVAERKDQPIPIVAGIFGVVMLLVINNLAHRHLLILPPVIMEKANILFGKNWPIVPTIVVLYLVPACAALAANMAILFQATKERNSERIESMRRSYLFVLRSASTILVFGILTSSLLRTSLLEELGNGFDYIFPSEFVLIYSLTFTFFIFILYGPNALLLFKEFGASQPANGNSDSPTKKMGIFWNPKILEIILSTLSPILTALIVEALKAV